MRPSRLLISCLLISVFSAASAQQIDSLDWGVRAGGIMPNYRGADFATIGGAGLIYRHREYPSLALELDAAVTLLDGELLRRDFSISTVSAYLAWRSSGQWYLKLRGGTLAEYVELGEASAWGGGLSGGIGAGWRRGEQLLEVELTGIEKAAYMVSLAWYF